MLSTFILFVTMASCNALYNAKDDVIELTAENFNNKVVNGDDLWMVEFYAPWCGHCKSLAPEWQKAAKALNGVVKVGAVDMDVHSSVGAPYNVRGFPTIKIFGANKNSPHDYQGQREAKGIVDAAMDAAKKMVNARLGGHGGQGSSGSSGSSDSSSAVVEVTDNNFEDTVLKSKDIVLVGFFAPWCGHCQRLKPDWEKAATQLKGKAKICSLDATVHKDIASKFNVQGYPTIKFFAAGDKDFNSAEDFEGGRTASDIVAFVEGKFVANVDPPEIIELIGNSTLAECLEKSLCIVSVLQDILDTQSEGRNQHIGILKKLGEKYKAKNWGWVWTAAIVHPKLEESLEIDGNYPAVTAINAKKKVYVKHIGGFDEKSIDSTLILLSTGKLRSTKDLSILPELESVPAWNGKDGELPQMEEIDLDDDEDDDANKDEL